MLCVGLHSLGLSDASKMTLEQQGGPMTREEAEKFEKDERLDDLLRMRTWDERAKVAGMEMEPLVKYREMFKRYMEGVLAANSGNTLPV